MNDETRAFLAALHRHHPHSPLARYVDAERVMVGSRVHLGGIARTVTAIEHAADHTYFYFGAERHGVGRWSRVEVTP